MIVHFGHLDTIWKWLLMYSTKMSQATTVAFTCKYLKNRLQSQWFYACNYNFFFCATRKCNSNDNSKTAPDVDDGRKDGGGGGSSGTRKSSHNTKRKFHIALLLLLYLCYNMSIALGNEMNKKNPSYDITTAKIREPKDYVPPAARLHGFDDDYSSAEDEDTDYDNFLNSKSSKWII